MMFSFLPLTGPSEPRLCIRIETPGQSKWRSTIQVTLPAKLEKELPRNSQDGSSIAGPVQVTAGRWARGPSLHNPCSWNHKGHRGNRLRSFPPVPVMVLATTLSYSIALPKDFQ